MNGRVVNQFVRWFGLIALVAVLPGRASALIQGDWGTVSGSNRTFVISAADARITMGDGETAYMWGYASKSANPVCPGGNCVQFPGPTLLVNQGDTVTVMLTNRIPTLPGNGAVNTSILFPGQDVSVGSGAGVAGLLTTEARPGETIAYTFVASRPGTFTYYSGTRPDLQIEMGLMGSLIVRPSGVGSAGCPAFANPAARSNGYAYCVRNGYYDREYLMVLSELDPAIHRLVEQGRMSKVDTTARHATAWFINGRNFPDTMAPDFAGWLPSQPYGINPQMHPLESVLMRVVGGGRDLHPLHTHGQNHLIIARDGSLLTTGLSPTLADMPVSDYTSSSVPGETLDAIYGPWTGEDLDWDVYGPPGSHTCSLACSAPPCRLSGLLAFTGRGDFDPTTGEWCEDHDKAIPVSIPAPAKLTFGQMYGGTPYLGITAPIPPIDPNTGAYHLAGNPLGGLSFMWHSHDERELTTNNVFIGGMATMAMILPYTVDIP
jgi:hypothetical protein